MVREERIYTLMDWWGVACWERKTTQEDSNITIVDRLIMWMKRGEGIRI